MGEQSAYQLARRNPRRTAVTRAWARTQEPLADHGAESASRILLTTAEAAKALGVSRTTLHGLVCAGEIAPVHIGRAVRYPKAVLEAYVRRLVRAQSRTQCELSGGS